MRERAKIRSVIRESLKRDGLSVYSGRTAPLSEKDLPCALVFMPRDRVETSTHRVNERELDVNIEVLIKPENDPESEIEALSEKIARRLTGSSELSQCTQRASLTEEVFEVETIGECVVAAAQISLSINYLQEIR